MLPEIADKFQYNLDLFFEALVERIQELVPELSPEEQKEVPFFIGDNLYATTIIYTYQDEALNTGNVAFMFYAMDISVNNNILTSSVEPFGRCDFDARWSSMTEEQRNATEISLNEYVPEHLTTVQTHEGDLRVTYYTSSAEISVVYGEPPVEHTSDVYRQLVTANSSIVKNTGLTVIFNNIDYSVDANGYISIVPSSDMWNLYISEYACRCIKGYPVILTSDNTTFINNFITNNGATNNYTGTYTSPGGETITYYYGDNYIIYNNSGDVSYDDLKHVFDIAVNQINDDNDTDINVPDYPVPPDPIESDNQEDGGNYNHAEFTKVYACTSAELNDLYQWMGGGAAGSSGDSPVTVPNDFDPMNRIVGLIGYPMIIDVGVGDATTFTFRNAANQTINTGWSTYKYGNFDREFDFGTVTIPNWEELENGAPFLDYSATVEIYIPFCGVVGLDPQAVMGCTLSCKMWIDFVTGDCSAVVYTNYGGEGSQHPVAFVSGNCGSAEVVSANAFGSYQGAKAQASHKMSQAILGGFKDLATSVIGGATTGFTRGAANPSGTGGNAGMRAGAIGSVIGGAMNLGVNLTLQNLDNRYAVQVAKNALGTTISGSFGQQTSWYYMDTPYIKVTWPTPISKDVELYGKTFGVPVHRSGALSEFTGYTVCNNVDVSGIAGATASELAIIKQFLETGVFIKEGGEE